MTANLSDNIYLVTGAASGMGRATCELLADCGARVVGIDQNEEGLRSLGSQTTLLAQYAIDVADRSAIRDMVTDVLRQVGRIDGCITFAATVDNWGPPADLDDDLWQRVIEVNLRGTTRICGEIIEAIPAGGAIVTCSSIAGGLKPNPQRAPYTAAKAAVIAHTRDLAVAYGPSGVRVNTIIPGFVDTPMSKQLIRGNEAAAETERRRIPLRRLGEAREVAEVARFLVSDSASYITGTAVTVDGGLSLV
ncbi:SDR family NAD(P)-dependent oxidoreductase [Dietzia timorensis]|uniref:SDR family NAD(P)-dependent oxidoreductase n=1 Tax=Dietzia timorensis TaxID=499555 RepID=UPI0009ED9ABF|nr:SDR family oxidoreductase [Dietzia timorensis]